VQVGLVTSRDLDSSYRTPLYPIYDILPSLEHRDAFDNVLSWGYSRLVHYYKREKTFLRWAVEPSTSDGIHFQEYTPWLAPQHLRWLKKRGKHLFFTVHNIYPHRHLPGALSPLYRRWIGLAFRQCDALFVHTEDLQRQLTEFLGAQHPPIFVTPHGIWTTTGSAATADSVAERVRRRHLLFFGWIRRTKGLPTLLRAMETLPDCTLTVAGTPEDPAYREEIRALVKGLPSGQVELIDRFIDDEEASLLFEKSSLVVLPYSSFAAQSGVLHDALAHRLPVVVTDVGALGQSVRAWGIGQVVPPEDSVSLGDAIREVLAPNRYEEACRAVERTRSDLSWDRAAEITIEAYRRA
jgi:glycosyltransferase involved in cell wall biosynthesis